MGLPTLNGIEAARRIRKLAPESKIILLSQESSADVVQEALALGALGYVVKAHAGSELLAAVEMVRQERQFVSSGLSGRSFNDARDARVPDPLCRKEALLSLAPRNGEIERSHAVEFYSDDASFLVGFARFIEAALRSGNAVIVVATKSHLDSLFRRLQAQGLNIDAAIEQGSYIPLDVAETLSTFMVNDLPDPVLFFKATTELVAAAAIAAKGEHPRVAACGECAPTLWAQGGGCGGSAGTPLGRDSLELQHGYFVRVCVEQLSARTGKPHLRENLCGTFSRLSQVNGHDFNALTRQHAWNRLRN